MKNEANTSWNTKIAHQTAATAVACFLFFSFHFVYLYICVWFKVYVHLSNIFVIVLFAIQRFVNRYVAWCSKQAVIKELKNGKSSESTRENESNRNEENGKGNGEEDANKKEDEIQ